MSGTISQDATWTAGGSPYIVTGDVTVAQGIRLTIDPGVVVKFSSAPHRLIINGSLVAEGTSDSKVYFTSLKDDSVAGDTNGDGGASSPAAGDWRCIELGASSSGNALRHAVIRFGGNTTTGIYASLLVNTSAHAITDCEFASSASYALQQVPGVTLNSAESDAHDNTTNGVRLTGTVSTDATCGAGDLPYVIPYASLTVQSGSRLAIEPGTVIKFDVGAKLTTNGALVAQGTAADQIYFTSLPDDTVAGDTNGDGGLSAPAKGDWASVAVASGGSGTFEDCTFRYGCYDDYNNWAVLKIYSPSHAIRECTFTQCDGAAIGAVPTVTLNVSGNEVSGNTRNGIILAVDRAVSTTINQNVSWPGDDLTLVMNKSLTVASGSTLSVESGAVVKVEGSLGKLTVKGTLSAVGEDSARIHFTSLKDDSVGGDTNGDGDASSPARGDWSCVHFDTGNTACTLRQLTVSYAGYLNWYTGSVHVTAGAPSLRNCVIRHSKFNGLSAMLTGSPDFRYNDVYDVETLWVRTFPQTYAAYTPYNWWGSYSPDPAGFTEGVMWQPPSSVPHSMTLAEARSQGLFGFTDMCAYWGDPVNASTGNYCSDSLDLSLPGIGPELKFERTYNSQDAFHAGPLGHGWTHNYHTSLRFDDGGAITVVHADAKRITYTPAGGGTFETSAPVTEDLSATAGGYSLRFADGTEYHYDDAGRLAEQTDRYGNVLAFAYSTGGKLTSVTGAGGRSLTFTYSDNRITRVEDSADRSVSFGYDTAGDLVSATDVRSKTTTYVYDANHCMTEHRRPEIDEEWLSHTYVDSRVTQQRDALGNTTFFDYSSEGDRTDILDGRGNVWVERFDEQFRRTSSVDPTGNAVAWTYNALGMVASERDGNGNTTTYGYDANRNKTLTRNAEGHETEASYDASGNVLWEEDELGSRTTYAYDPAGRLLESITRPAATTTYYDYYASGLLKTEHSAGATTTYTYDPKGNLATLTDPLGKISAFGWDAASRLTASTDALGNTTRFDYDAAGNLIEILDPLSLLFPQQRHQVDFTYDANGNRTSFTDALGNSTRYTYDAMGNLTGVLDAAESTTTYSYDANYNLSGVTDARGNETTYTYTPSNLIEAVTDPVGRTWTFGYDRAGNVTETVAPDRSRTLRTYWTDDMLKSLSFDTEETRYDFTYEPTNWLDSVADNLGRVFDYDYDSAGWLTRAEDTVNPSVAGGFETTYAYDEAGRVAGVRASDEATRSYVFDLRGDLIRLELPGDGQTHTTYAYDDGRRRTSAELPDGSARSWSYDAASRVTSIVTTTTSGVLAFDYSRDANGNVTRENSTRYTYDELNRLTSWYDPSADTTTTYDYDETGNLLAVTEDGQTVTSFSYDAANRISSAGYEYDERGNMTDDPEHRCVYDAANRLTAVIDASTETTIASYEYDYLNRRMSSTEGTRTVFFHYDGASSRVITETDESGATIVSFAYDDRGAIHSMRRGDATYFYHVNAHGDVLALTDESGEIVNEYTYDPWGAPTSIIETVENPYRYAGYRFNERTGLYYLWNRYYDYETCRFLTRDPLRSDLVRPATLNPYGYCSADPVNNIDPLGGDWFSLSLTSMGAFAGGAAMYTGAMSMSAGATVTLFGLGPFGWSVLAAGAFAGGVGYAYYQWQSDQVDSTRFWLSVGGSALTLVPGIGSAWGLGMVGWEAAWTASRC